tara:strand:+ start:545 stop:697 length:153 start_codon:yes stop_codon:yes gene_type:complete
MDDYNLAVILSTFVLVPVGIFKISGMVKKLQKLSSSNKESKKKLGSMPRN